MSERQPPRNIDAERAVLGAMLLSRQAREDMANLLAAADFYDQRHAAIFAGLVQIAQEGKPADRLLLLDRLGGSLDEPGILELQTASPSTYNASEHASLVARAAIARRAIGVLDQALHHAWAGDPSAALESIDTAHDVLVAPFDDVAMPTDALDLAAEDHDHDWVVRSLLARHETVLFVAEPGSGKTTLLNQMAVCLACGLHPWTRSPIPRMRVLVFDFQDSRGARGRGVQSLLSIVGDRYERGHLFYELHTQGTDLTQRSQQRWFEAKVAKSQPDLVIVGPLYNAIAGARERSKQSEETAQLAASFLSELVVRRDCAMLVEAHAPHGEELRVRGSKLWEDWAAFGFGLRASIVDGKREFKVERFRGDRETGRQWPSRFVQGHPEMWPWDALGIPADSSGGTEQMRSERGAR